MNKSLKNEILNAILSGKCRIFGPDYQNSNKRYNPNRNELLLSCGFDVNTPVFLMPDNIIDQSIDDTKITPTSDNLINNRPFDNFVIEMNVVDEDDSNIVITALMAFNHLQMQDEAEETAEFLVCNLYFYEQKTKVVSKEELRLVFVPNASNNKDGNISYFCFESDPIFIRDDEKDTTMLDFGDVVKEINGLPISDNPVFTTILTSISCLYSKLTKKVNTCIKVKVPKLPPKISKPKGYKVPKFNDYIVINDSDKTSFIADKKNHEEIVIGHAISTKKPHFRRGHIRRYKTGKEVWVKSARIHKDNEKGVTPKPKNYAIK